MNVKKQPEKINDEELDQVRGGIAMLLPAVQAAREAARSSKKKTTKKKATTEFASTAGGNPNV